MRKSLPILFLVILPLASCGSGGIEGSEDLTYGEVDREAAPEGFEGDAEFYATNGQRFYEGGDYPAALTQFRKQLSKDPTSTSGRLGEAFSLYQLGKERAKVGSLKEADARFEAAREVFEKLANELPLEADTTDGDGFGWKSRLGLAMTDCASAALARRQLDRIDASITGITNPADRRRAKQAQGDLRELRNRRNAIALERFSQLATMNNAAPDSILYEGDMHIILGNERQAERSYFRYLDLCRNSVKSWEERRKQAPDHIASKNELKLTLQQIEIKRSSAVAKTVGVLSQLAEIKFRRANYADSLELLEEAIATDPERYDLHVPIAECNDKLENKVKALEHIEVYLRSVEGFDANARKASKMRARLIEELRAERG